MIDPGLVASLRAVHEALGTHRIPYAIFGARVLELRAAEVSRARLDLPETVDIDLAVIVSSWAEFDRAKEALGRAGFEPTEIEHRLGSTRFGDLDVVPCGEALEVAGELVWPKSGRRMKVAALRDALAAATAVSIPKGLEIPVVTIPGFVLTKIEAYRERRYSRPVDLPHIFACLKHYPGEDPAGLRYDCAGVEVDGEMVGYLEAGAWLIGQGILAIASARPLAAVRRFLEAASDPYSPEVSQLVSPAAEESDRVRIARLFRVAGRGAGAG